MALFITKINTTETNFSFSDPVYVRLLQLSFVKMPTFLALLNNKIHYLNVLRRSFHYFVLVFQQRNFFSISFLGF